MNQSDEKLTSMIEKGYGKKSLDSVSDRRVMQKGAKVNTHEQERHFNEH